MNPFQKATKKQSKLRCAIFGPSGSGKTFTGLRIATGLGGKIAVIDTERGSASKYSDRFEFDVCELQDKSIAGYVKTIKSAHGNYDILQIDSLSHGWQELLEKVEKLAQAKYRGNTWSAWSEGTPEQRELVDAILDFPGHVIATMRSKTEWTTAKQDNGKSAPVRVGLAPEQGKGIEYEFDLLLELTVEHVGHILKDRTGKFQDQLIDKPGEDFGKDLAAWLSEGEEVKPEQPKEPAPIITEDQAKTGNIAKLRALFEKERGEHELADYEGAFCKVAKDDMKFGMDYKSLEEFTLDLLRIIWPKRNAYCAKIAELYASATKP